VDATFSLDDVRDATRLARDCQDPVEPEPFDLADVNRKLAELAERGSPS